MTLNFNLNLDSYRESYACVTVQGVWHSQLLIFLTILTALVLLSVQSGIAQAATSSSFFEGNWQKAPDEVREYLIKQSPIDDVISFSESTTIMSTKLPFYKGVSLLVAHGDWQPDELLFYYLYTDNGEIERITGKSDLLMRVRGADRFNVDPEYYDEYLWFTLYFSRNDNHKPFLVLDSEDTIEMFDIAASDSSLKQRIKNTIKPINCRSEIAGNYRCSVYVLYEKALYLSTMDVARDGKVSMIDDTALFQVLYDPPVPLGVWAVSGEVRQGKAGSGNAESSSAEGEKTENAEGWAF